MIEGFEKAEIIAIGRLYHDGDFKLFRKFIQRQVGNLAMISVNQEGPMAEKTKGGCICMKELMEAIESAKSLYADGISEESESDRDPISP